MTRAIDGPSPSTRGRLGAGIAIALCVTVTLVEGLDIQAIGVAAPGIVAEYHLAPAQMGWLFSASLLGMMMGSLAGGRVADRIGRKWTLVGATAIFGTFAMATPFAHSFESFAAARLLTGLGLGGAMPSLIALASENSPARWRSAIVPMLWAGTPAGGMVAAWLVAGGMEWRSLFYLGGAAPLLLAALMAIFLPESYEYTRYRKTGHGSRVLLVSALFGDGRALSTTLIWTVNFFTLLVLYLLLNWLPLLAIGSGLPALAARSATFFNAGGCAGSLLIGALLAAVGARRLMPLVYAVMVVALVLLASSGGDARFLLGSVFVAGFGVMGGQFAFFGVIPSYYPANVRGTGVGAAVAFGRLGSFAGPIVGGFALSAGLPAQMLLMLLVPAALIAGLAIVFLVRRPPLVGHAAVG